MTDYLSNQNPHPRDARIAFDPIPHVYTVDNDASIKYTSVTTWVHSHFEHFDADAIIDGMMRSKRWPENKYYGMTKDEIKAAWDTNRDQAASAGTDMHYNIELYYNHVTPLSELPDTPELTYFRKFAADYAPSLRPYRTEWMIFHEEARLSGSVDMVYENIDPTTGAPDGTLSIYDWKRCKEIIKADPFGKFAKTEALSHLPDTNYWHYCLQLNTYKAILQEKYGKVVTDLYLVCLHPNNKNGSYLRIKVADLQEDVCALIRDMAVSNANKQCE